MKNRANFLSCKIRNKNIKKQERKKKRKKKGREGGNQKEQNRRSSQEHKQENIRRYGKMSAGADQVVCQIRSRRHRKLIQFARQMGQSFAKQERKSNNADKNFPFQAKRGMLVSFMRYITVNERKKKERNGRNNKRNSLNIA